MKMEIAVTKFAFEQYSRVSFYDGITLSDIWL